MKVFIYKARDGSGAVVTGELAGDSPKDVKFALADKGLIPISVSQKRVKGEGVSSLFKKRVPIKDLLAFTRQFSALFKAGVPIDRIFETLSGQVRDKRFKEVITEIGRDVSRGSSLQSAFSKHPFYFNDIYISMLSVGEEGGSLSEALINLSSILEREYTVKNQVKSATIYPKIVVLVFIAVLILMLTFVIPRLASFYEGFHATLPLPTRLVLGASGFVTSIVKDYPYIAFPVLIALFFGFKKYSSSEKGKFFLDRMRLQFPVFGTLNLMVANARFAHLVSALYKGGLPLVKTLSIVGKAIGNMAFEREVLLVSEEVRKGSSLAKALSGKRYFTPIVLESVAAGEESGALDEILELTGSFYDDEISAMLKNLTTLIEPLLLVGLFGMVLLLALAVLLPIWRLSSVILPGGH